MEYIKVEIGGGLEYRHAVTGELLHMVSEKRTMSGYSEFSAEEPYDVEYTVSRPAK